MTPHDRDALRKTSRLRTIDASVVALPPPSRRLRRRLRYAATAASLRLRKRRAGCPWPSMAASVTASCKLTHARRPASRLRAHCCAECAAFCSASTRIAARTARLPLRYRMQPPSPCRACSPRPASRLPRALTRLWRAVRHNADYPQCRRWPRSNSSHVRATLRGPSPALFARVVIVSHDRVAMRARRIIDVMSTGRAHPALAAERRSCGACALAVPACCAAVPGRAASCSAAQARGPGVRLRPHLGRALPPPRFSLAAAVGSMC